MKIIVIDRINLWLYSQNFVLFSQNIQYLWKPNTESYRQARAAERKFDVEFFYQIREHIASWKSLMRNM